MSHKRAKPPFLWSASMTEYVLLLQIWHFEMQIWTWKKKKLLWIKVDLVWKASLCVTAQPFRPCCTFQAYVLQRAATGLIALTGDTSLKRSHVSASRRNMQREEFLIKKKKESTLKFLKRKFQLLCVQLWRTCAVQSSSEVGVCGTEWGRHLQVHVSKDLKKKKKKKAGTESRVEICSVRLTVKLTEPESWKDQNRVHISTTGSFTETR